MTIADTLAAGVESQRTVPHGKAKVPAQVLSLLLKKPRTHRARAPPSSP